LAAYCGGASTLRRIRHNEGEGEFEPIPAVIDDTSVHPTGVVVGETGLMVKIPERAAQHRCTAGGTLLATLQPDVNTHITMAVATTVSVYMVRGAKKTGATDSRDRVRLELLANTTFVVRLRGKHFWRPDAAFPQILSAERDCAGGACALHLLDCFGARPTASDANRSGSVGGSLGVSGRLGVASLEACVSAALCRNSDAVGLS
jgi:hypothetical protein